MVFTVVLVLFSFAKNFLPHQWERWAHGIAGTLAALFTTMLFLQFDRKKLADIGLRLNSGTVLRFISGVLVGILIMGTMALAVMHWTDVTIQWNQNSSGLHFLLMTAPLLPLAYMEELGFRAYPLVILREKTGIRTSLIITAVLFALYHIANGWSVAGSFYGPAVWGLIFGLAALYSKGIALPTGIHYAANLTTAAFGVAGNTISIWTVEGSANTAVSTGNVDWLAIIPSIVLLVFAIICIELYIRRERAGL